MQEPVFARVWRHSSGPFQAGSENAGHVVGTIAVLCRKDFRRSRPRDCGAASWSYVAAVGPRSGRRARDRLSCSGRAGPCAGRAAAAGPEGEARRGRRAAGSGAAGGGAKRRP